MATITDEPTTEQAAPSGIAWWSAALAGVLAAVAAVAAAELVAALVPDAASPVTSIGNTVIDLAPPALKDAAIEALGTADKPVLIGTVLLVLALAAAGAGVLATRRFWWGALGVALLGGVGVVAGLVDDASSGIGAVLPSLAAIAAGIPALWVLVRAAQQDAQAPESTGRRALLRASALVGGLAVAAGGLGRWLADQAEAATAPETAQIPPADMPLPAVPEDAAVAVEDMTPFVTPNDQFYRIDTALRVPTVNVDTWQLRIHGMVDTPMELRFDQLLDRYDVIEADVTLACVSNEVGGDLVGNARWRGVRLADVLADAGVRGEADQLVGRAVDGFTAGAPVEAVLDGRDALIAVGMNGEPLPRKHGYPARLVVPGLYGYVSATKWLAEIELTTFDAFDAYWIPRGWAERAPIKTQSRIDVPRPLATVQPGKVAIAGVAWAQTRGIQAVEVRIDRGEWKPARLGAEVGKDSWRQWVYEWDARPGRHELVVRATDGTGEVQTGERTQARPDGAAGRHTIAVTVADA
jgi:DMSO/TMAO reductase YedYZ molybdopterin-dependent catalytic subunit